MDIAEELPISALDDVFAFCLLPGQTKTAERNMEEMGGSFAHAIPRYSLPLRIFLSLPVKP